MNESFDASKFLNRATCSSLSLATQIQYAAEAHISSFNFIYNPGLEKLIQYLPPLQILQSSENDTHSKPLLHLPFKQMKIWFEELSIGMPFKQGSLKTKDARLYPSECRIAGKTYSAPLLATLARTIDDSNVETMKICLGEIPIMVRSEHCHLYRLSPKELVERHEDCNEFGGYFIINGLEKLIRMLIIQKKNYPIAFIRNSYMNRGTNFTGFAVQMKCVREDLYSRTLTLHYISDGNIISRLIHRKQEFLIPIIVILKALMETSDLQIYNKLVKGYQGKSQISDRVEVLLRVGKKLGLNSSNECLSYLGSNFRVMLNITDSSLKDREVGEIFLQEHVCVHLKSNLDKFNSICFMIEKLYSLVSEEIQPDNLDSLVNQEILLPGHLYLMILREKLEELLLGIRLKMMKDCQKSTEKIRELSYIKKAIENQIPIGRKIEYFLSTGNLKSQSGLDLMQAKGYTIIAEKLNNMRFLSHFRSVHRGAFFAEMKTTTVRKLLPENWGFICPVHTPDGHPCGLLNHISITCNILSKSALKEEHCDISKLCVSLGMNACNSDLNIIYPSNHYTVMLDGRVIGYVSPEKVNELIGSLRYLKVKQNPELLIPKDLEIGFIPQSPFPKTNQYPGLFLFTREARLCRPVHNLLLNDTEFISPFEQIYLSIACVEEDIRTDTEYQELNPANILSVLASNIPFLEYNQSPRNMYQCQMAKQTMGTSFHNHPYRFDNKVYRLITPQLPLVKGKTLEDYGLADYPSGTNAVVAVISYTGYDMEDAMILNKSSYERGMAHGAVYKSYVYNLNENPGSGSKKARFKFLNSAANEQNNEKFSEKKPLHENLDSDGLSRIGVVAKKHTPELAVWDTNKNEMKTFFHKENEQGRIEQIALVSNETNPSDVRLVYKLRYSRNPVIGDKFSSRHGQKGVLSVLWPQTDMPFTETGITPDVIINPNAFPSRMTIGMLIESLAGKAGAMNGNFQITEPFKQFENDDAVQYFGKQLIKKGFNYYGNEVMYSGIYGNVMKAEIYIGVVYYQRLRHMVSDKSQARSTGPVDVLTQQPVKGRKKQGGIRLGEMERDALLAHGVAFCLHDRLLNSSDYSEGYVCRRCGGLLSSFLSRSDADEDVMEIGRNEVTKSQAICRSCKGESVEKVALPFVLRYLTNELAAMNIKLSFNLG